MKIMIIPGLTLPEVGARDLARIEAAAGAEAEVFLCSPGDAEKLAEDVDVILGLVPEHVFAAAPKLRWVHAIASGVDMFLYPAFINSPVQLTSEKGLVGEHLADTGFGLLLMLTRQLASALRHGPDSWNHRPEMRYQQLELTGLTMGLFGFGGTGRAMARRAAAFGMTCVALDCDPVPPSPEVTQVFGSHELPQLLGQSDVLAVCCPLTPQTRGLLDAEFYRQMKEGAWLVNVTRGEVMVEDALVTALESGKLRGAALDVAPREPLPAESRLWSLPNVVMTPHTAGASQYRARRNIDRFVRNIPRFKAGARLEGLIDKRAGY